MASTPPHQSPSRSESQYSNTIPTLRHEERPALDAISEISEDPKSLTKRGIVSATRIRSVIAPKDIHVGYAL